MFVVGLTAHEVVLPGCGDCPAEYGGSAEACPSLDGRPSLQLTLPAGSYTVVGEYAAADPSVQFDLIEDGFSYTDCLFVTRTR